MMRKLRWLLLLTLTLPPLGRAHEPVRRARKPRLPAPGGKLTPAQRDSVLLEHNRARRAVGVPPLAWSADLSRYAQTWANHLAATSCELQHRQEVGRDDGRSHGENLGAGGYIGRVDGWTPAEGVREWLAEKKHYRGGPLGPDWLAAGHYTQLVWRDTRRLGCGLATCRKGEWTWRLLVCNYDPPGNFMGQKPY